VGPRSPPSCAPYPVSIADPFTQIESPFPEGGERLLEWYFEEHLRFPFADHDKAEAARQSITAYGEGLFRAVFADPEAYVQYKTAAAPGLHALSLEVMGSPAFQALHWEALKDPKLPRALALDVPLVRRRLIPQAFAATVTQAPTLNILVVTARPQGGRDVGYRTVSRPLVEALGQAEVPARIEILRPGTYQALSNHLQEAFDRHGAGHYHVLHLDVHGALLNHAELAALPAPDRMLFRYGRPQGDLQGARQQSTLVIITT
jgi:hypothetical protein